MKRLTSSDMLNLSFFMVSHWLSHWLWTHYVI